ncbi:tRNA (adenosine(37)-N6)-threonylcarbamoyltransferase complex dimerization subunit type 1 TsaB [Pikeienuella sp. HZG-20]|uniref:tRNA (adenosine(37)-N6)-threonylcarbamoyltransferase complex dimerization subunit type 1 TsaB n=1 Tax=Paludibacillus litoralis TaxID=3133267 RepID=UPI0030ED7249
MPLTLVIDTAAGRCAAALFDGERALGVHDEPLAKGHAERLFPMIGECLASAGRGYAEIGLIAVCTGPGNFTGARIGVAAARGLALSTGAAAVGVDRFEALADGRDGVVCVALSGRGGALHLARFEDGAPTREAETLQPEAGAAFAEGALVIGGGAAALGAALGAIRIGDMTDDAPLVAFARVAARKALSGAPRPAPRYLRPANAAPARGAAPQILP